MPKSSKESKSTRLATSRSHLEALSQLVDHVDKLVANDSLDPRFARKLLKRIVEEAECVEPSSREQWANFESAVGHVQDRITGRQATDFVAAFAALRERERPELPN